MKIKKITEEIQSRKSKYHKDEGFPDETKIAQQVQNLLEKLANPREIVTKSDIDKLFKLIEENLDKMTEKWSKCSKQWRPITRNHDFMKH